MRKINIKKYQQGSGVSLYNPTMNLLPQGTPLNETIPMQIASMIKPIDVTPYFRAQELFLQKEKFAVDKQISLEKMELEKQKLELDRDLYKLKKDDFGLRVMDFNKKTIDELGNEVLSLDAPRLEQLKRDLKIDHESIKNGLGDLDTTSNIVSGVGSLKTNPEYVTMIRRKQHIDATTKWMNDPNNSKYITEESRTRYHEMLNKMESDPTYDPSKEYSVSSFGDQKVYDVERRGDELKNEISELQIKVQEKNLEHFDRQSDDAHNTSVITLEQNKAKLDIYEERTEHYINAGLDPADARLKAAQDANLVNVTKEVGNKNSSSRKTIINGSENYSGDYLTDVVENDSQVSINGKSVLTKENIVKGKLHEPIVYDNWEDGPNQGQLPYLRSQNGEIITNSPHVLVASGYATADEVKSYINDIESMWGIPLSGIFSPANYGDNINENVIVNKDSNGNVTFHIKGDNLVAAAENTVPLNQRGKNTIDPRNTSSTNPFGEFSYDKGMVSQTGVNIVIKPSGDPKTVASETEALSTLPAQMRTILSTVPAKIGGLTINGIAHHRSENKDGEEMYEFDVRTYDTHGKNMVKFLATQEGEAWLIKNGYRVLHEVEPNVQNTINGVRYLVNEKQQVPTGNSRVAVRGGAKSAKGDNHFSGEHLHFSPVLDYTLNDTDIKKIQSTLGSKLNTYNGRHRVETFEGNNNFINNVALVEENKTNGKPVGYYTKGTSSNGDVLGRYGITWSQHKNNIKELYGITDPNQFLYNEDVQDNYMNYLYEHKYKPNASALKDTYNADVDEFTFDVSLMSVDEIAYLMHKEGPTGAINYLKTGSPAPIKGENAVTDPEERAKIAERNKTRVSLDNFKAYKAQIQAENKVGTTSNRDI